MAQPVYRYERVADLTHTNQAIDDNGSRAVQFTKTELNGSGFADNDEVLVLAYARFGHTVGTGNVTGKVYYGGSLMPVNNWTIRPGAGDGATRIGMFMERVSLGTIPTEGFSFHISGGGNTARIRDASLFVIRLSDFGTENTDWFWNRSTSGQTHTTLYSSTGRASVTWTPASVKDWVYFAYAWFDGQNTNISYEGEVTLDGTLDSGDFSAEVVDNAEEIPTVWWGVAPSLSAASHTLAVQTRDDSAGTQNIHRESALFVFRKDLFTDIYYHEQSSVSVASTAQIATVTNTLSDTMDLFIWGQQNQNNSLNASTYIWAEDGGTSLEPDSESDATYVTASGRIKDALDEHLLGWQGLITSKAPGALDIDLYGSGGGTAYRPGLLVWGLKLDAGVTTVSASFTLDSVIKKERSGSFSLDAYIVGLTDFSLDAILRRETQSSLAIDAVVRASMSGSFTLDAYISRPPVVSSLVLDAIVKKVQDGVDHDDEFDRTVSGGWGADYEGWNAETEALMSVNPTDGALFAENETISTYKWRKFRVKKPRRLNRRVTMRLAVKSISTFNVDYNVASIYMRHDDQLGSGLDYYTSEYIALDIRLYNPNGFGDFTINQGNVALAVRTQEDRSVLIGPGEVDTDLTWAPTSVDPDSKFYVKYVVKGTSPTRVKAKIWRVGDVEPTDWLLNFTTSDGPTAEGWLVKGTGSRVNSTPTWAWRRVTMIRTEFEPELDAVIRGTVSSARVLDAVLRAPVAGSFSLDARLTIPGAGGSGEATLDAIIRGTQAGSFTLDATSRRTAVLSFSTGSVLRATTSASLVLDAITRVPRAASFTLDSWQRKANQSAITLDGVVAATRTAGFTSDAVFLSPRSGSFALDAWIVQRSFGSITLDAIARRGVVGSFALAAVLRAAIAGSWTQDAIVRKTRTEPFTLDAVGRRKSSGSLTADAVTKRTMLGDLALDAVITVIRTGTHGVTLGADTIGATLGTPEHFGSTITSRGFTASTFVARAGSFTLSAEIA